MRGTRFISDFYHSVRQESLSSSVPDTVLKDYYLARLRMDHFFCREHVIADSDLYDGALFQLFTPAELADALGVDEEPGTTGCLFEVRCRADCLETSLLRDLCRGDTPKLSHNLFSSAPTHVQAAAAEELARTPKSEVNSYRDVLGLLRRMKLGRECDGWIERLDQAWSEWFGSSRLKLASWGSGPLALGQALSAEPPDDVASRMRPAGRALVGRLFDLTEVDIVKPNLWRKSLHEKALDLNSIKSRLDAAKSAEDGELSEDAKAVETWYYSAYVRARSIEYGCSVESIDTSDRPRSGLFSRAWEFITQGPKHPTAPLGLPELFLDWLAKLEPREYRKRRSEARVPLMEWWTSGSQDHLRRAIGILCKDFAVQTASLPRLNALLGHPAAGAITAVLLTQLDFVLALAFGGAAAMPSLWDKIATPVRARSIEAIVASRLAARRPAPPGGGHPVVEPEQTLARTQQEIGWLEKERARHEERLAEVDRGLVELKGAKGRGTRSRAAKDSAGKSKGKKPGRRKMTLADHVAEVLAGAQGPMSPAQIAEALKRRGVSGGKHLNRQVAQILRRGKVAVRKVGRGQYVAGAE